MATLTEANSWEAGIYQLELTDPVVGGADGLSNLQAKQLANRTLYLKNLVEALGNGKQPLDATLTALAGVVTAANQLIYATGADTFATTALSAFARTLLDDADAATARGTLGAQAEDATLTALAGVVTAANQLIYATGADTFATTSLSAFIRTLLDDADAATARTTLGAAPLASPAFTGIPTVPTAAAGTNTTQAASTAFVQAALAVLGALTTSDFTGSNQSLASNGYQKLPGGLIIQWGSFSAQSIDSYSITWPIAYPSACVLAIGGWSGADSVAGILGSTSLTTTGMEGNMNGTGTKTVKWFSLGY